MSITRFLSKSNQHSFDPGMLQGIFFGPQWWFCFTLHTLKFFSRSTWNIQDSLSVPMQFAIHPRLDTNFCKIFLGALVSHRWDFVVQIFPTLSSYQILVRNIKIICRLTSSVSINFMVISLSLTTSLLTLVLAFGFPVCWWLPTTWLSGFQRPQAYLYIF
jgi:hypothetical protein